MRPRARVAAFGICLALVVAGILCAVLVGGLAGALLAFVLIAVGLVFATSLVFLEVGISEDRARARDLAVDARAAPGAPGPGGRRPRPRLARLRSHRRGLN